MSSNIINITSTTKPWIIVVQITEWEVLRSSKTKDWRIINITLGRLQPLSDSTIALTYKLCLKEIKEDSDQYNQNK